MWALVPNCINVDYNLQYYWSQLAIYFLNTIISFEIIKLFISRAITFGIFSITINLIDKLTKIK